MPDVTIDDVRSKYPQYKDLSDDQLADGLHKKFYSDMPREQFDKKIGLKQEKPTTLAQGLAAPFQVAGAMATSTLAPGFAAAENLLTGKTSDKDYSEAKKSWSYSPTNPVAQKDLEVIGNLPGIKQIGQLT